MSKQPVIVIGGEIVEECPELTLRELSQACGLPAERLLEYVDLGIIEPAGSGVHRWRFASTVVTRLHKASRLQRDFGLDPAALALVLDLLDEMDRLRARLRRLRAE